MMAFFENSSRHAPESWMRGSHDIRLRSMEDRVLRMTGVLNEEREVLASRVVLGRYSSFFRNILSTIPVGGAVSPWTLLSLFSFHRLARLMVAMLPSFVGSR